MRASLDTSDFRTLIVIANSKTLKEAAQTLGVSTLRLSRGLKRLERQLGIRLMLQRTPDIVLTDAGRLLADRFVIILGLLKQVAYDMNVSPEALQRFCVPPIQPFNANEPSQLRALPT